MASIRSAGHAHWSFTDVRLLCEHIPSWVAEKRAMTVLSTVVGWILLLGIVWTLFRLRARRKARRHRAVAEMNDGSRFVRGSDLYWRSRNNINVAPFARQAQGLPLYHDENQWVDPPR